MPSRLNSLVDVTLAFGAASAEGVVNDLDDHYGEGKVFDPETY